MERNGLTLTSFLWVCWSGGRGYGGRVLLQHASAVGLHHLFLPVQVSCLSVNIESQLPVGFQNVGFGTTNQSTDSLYWSRPHVQCLHPT